MRKLLVVFVAVVIAFACSGRKTSPECDEIAERCHEISMGANATATQKDCHESAESTWTAAECTTNHAMCFSACVLPDGGPP